MKIRKLQSSERKIGRLYGTSSETSIEALYTVRSSFKMGHLMTDVSPESQTHHGCTTQQHIHKNFKDWMAGEPGFSHAPPSIEGKKLINGWIDSNNKNLAFNRKIKDYNNRRGPRTVRQYNCHKNETGDDAHKRHQQQSGQNSQSG